MFGWLQSGKDLSFGAKPLHQIGRLRAPAYHLDGYDLEVLVVGADGQKDSSHSSVVQLSHQTIGTHPETSLSGSRVLGQFLEVMCHQGRKHIFGIAVALQ